MSQAEETNHDKIYNDWNKLKKRIDKTPIPPKFNVGEIWWCSIGRNIGVEIYGKGKKFFTSNTFHRQK